MLQKMHCLFTIMIFKVVHIFFKQQMSDSSPDSSSNYSLSDIITTSGISENDLHCSQGKMIIRDPCE